VPATVQSLQIEQGFRDRLLLRALQAAQAINARFALIDPEDLTTSFHNMVGELAALIALGQRDAQVLAQVFLNMHFEVEQGRAAPLRPASQDIAGTTFDGRSINGLVSGFIPVVFIALNRGTSLDTALNLGRHAVWRAAITEITDAASRELTYQSERLPQMTGWTWVTGGSKPCGACLAMQNGEVWPWSVPMSRHAGCSCVQSPAYANDPGTVQRPTGQDIFDGMTPEQQASTFKSGGEAKAEAINNGEISLSDLVKVETHETWRDSITEASLEDLGISVGE
jgi:hypothetical protein